ncbi:MAG: hypothetical protein WCG75_11245 [Armatimonadota bacterium]
MLQWENTDQFGNLKVATSSATNIADVEPDLRDLARAVFDQHSENVKFSIDITYAEISAPRGDQVSHVLNLPFVSELVANGGDKQAILHELANHLKDIVGDPEMVVGPWD